MRLLLFQNTPFAQKSSQHILFHIKTIGTWIMLHIEIVVKIDIRDFLEL